MNLPRSAVRFGGAILIAGLAAAILLEAGPRAKASEGPHRLPPPESVAAAPAPGGMQTAVLAGGCFWGVQGVFEHVRGVRSVVAGYAGGGKATAHYETVSTGVTGHAESVRITFDPSQISYGEILRIFFSVATDPTQVNAQFPDEGTQYRSEIFYLDEGQRDEARAYIAQLTKAHAFARPIATRVDPLTGFFPAEAYHQNYLERHPDAPYIATYDLPKVRALKILFAQEYSPTPVLVR